MNLYFTLLTALLSSVLKTNIASNGPAPKLKCYDQDDLKGAAIETWSSVVNIAQITPSGHSGKIVSCSVTGTWLFYSGVGYTGDVQAVNGLNTRYKPINLTIRSAHLAANPNVKDQLLLFRKPNFLDDWPLPIYDTTLKFSKAEPVQSLILIGDSNFTIISECDTLCNVECHYCVMATAAGVNFQPNLINVDKIIEIHKGNCNKDILPMRWSLRKDCGCYEKGRLGKKEIGCDKNNQCRCKPGARQADCRCQVGYLELKNGSCKKCVCWKPGLLDQNITECFRNNTCKCKPDPRRLYDCSCQDGYYQAKSGKCEPCRCDRYRSRNNVCNKTTGQCLCKGGYTFRSCCALKDRLCRGEWNGNPTGYLINTRNLDQKACALKCRGWWACVGWHHWPGGYCRLFKKGRNSGYVITGFRYYKWYKKNGICSTYRNCVP